MPSLSPRPLAFVLASLAVAVTSASCNDPKPGAGGGGAGGTGGTGPTGGGVTQQAVVPRKPAPPAPKVAEVLRSSDGRIGDSSVQIGSPYGMEQKEGADKTLAPYLYVGGGDPEKDRLPLAETTADVRIAGVIARVKVKQVFVNGGEKPIEAVYVFPGSTRSAVHGMRMRIGDRTIEAQIEEKKEARRQYEEAKEQGKRASLLEQERPNVFTMNVANIMPRDRIEVELDYTELLEPEDALYEFVYPTVVGPRYGGGADPEKDQYINNPTLPEGVAEPYKWGIAVHLETGVPIKEVSSPSHEIKTTNPTPTSADVALAEPGGGNKDFVLRYRLAGDKVETGLLLYPSAEENFFLLMLEPPARPTDAQIPPREYIFVIDVSGSMWGFPIDTAKVLMKDLLGGLRPTDWFNVVLFAGGSEILRASGSLPATESNVQAAFSFIDRPAGGGTELLAGLKAAYGIPRPDKADLSRTVVVVTDGYVGVEAKTFQFIRGHLGEANLFSFGIGSSVNRALIEGMARAGMGEPQVLLGPEKAKEQADRFREYIRYPVLTGIQVAFEGLEAYDVAPEKLPDLLARRPLVVYGKYRGEPRGKIVVTGHTGEGVYRQEVALGKEALAEANAPIRFLWARKWVGILEDQLAVLPNDEGITDAITNMGLSYGLLTAFTSFVAIDSQVVNQGGQGDKVRQPLPMPEGVSNNALPASPAATAASSTGVLGALSGTGVGGGGTGAGYGIGSGRGAMGAAPPARTRAAGPMGRPSPVAADRADEDGPAEPALLVMVVQLKPEGLSDAGALVTAVERALNAHGTRCGLKSGAKLTVTLKVDASGKIVQVTVQGAGAAGDCLRRSLSAVTSATKATTAGATGTLTLSIEIR